MFEYFKGKIVELNASYLILEINNIGYFINISMTTYSSLKDKAEVKLYTHQVIKEDSHQIYGFLTKVEREVFLKLISVSGIGANTARLFLSSMEPSQIVQAIVNEDAKLLSTIKGVGTKTAQRTIVELKDKFKEVQVSEVQDQNTNPQVASEAMVALELLGFNKKAVEKTVVKLLKADPTISVENLIKQSLKHL
jgi:Holliday junction DNA helicase RuvA